MDEASDIPNVGDTNKKYLNKIQYDDIFHRSSVKDGSTYADCERSEVNVNERAEQALPH